MEVVTSGCRPLKPSTCSKQGIVRPYADFDPSPWGDYFITHPSLPSTTELETWMKQRVGELIAEVKVMIRDANDPMLEMHLIDVLQRLGVDYHFEKEIHEALLWIRDLPTNDGDDLHRTALRFRLLRQACYDAPSDVFEKFKDDQGNFKSAFGSDLNGLLSLYEAAYLAKPGEDVLHQAITYARIHLGTMASHLQPRLAKHVMHALETPLHKRMRRLESRLYISMYEQDEETRNDVVLELAKLDFRLLQLIHREEIHTISMWSKKLGLSTKLTFARDRIVECYFWILGVYFEPHHTRARMMMTKITTLISYMDDIYDAYGTLDELQEYTDTVQRWNLAHADELEECMKLHFLALTSTIKDFEEELASEGFSYRIHYIKEEIKELSRAYLEDAKMREKGSLPSFEDHLRVSLVTSTYGALTCASFLGMREVATEEFFDWVTTFPKVIKASSQIGRFMNDVVSYKFELKRWSGPTTVQCFAKEHRVSFQTACDKLLILVEDSWQAMNQEFLSLTSVPTTLLMPILNLSRTTETVYSSSDNYTHSQALKDDIMILLVQPIPLQVGSTFLQRPCENGDLMKIKEIKE